MGKQKQMFIISISVDDLDYRDRLNTLAAQLSFDEGERVTAGEVFKRLIRAAELDRSWVSE